MKFEITMRPTGMSRTKRGMPRPELAMIFTADDTADAVRQAREQAAAEGFNGYAITKIKEITQ
jgi:hypothetical protein